jgi:hypothetical protein
LEVSDGKPDLTSITSSCTSNDQIEDKIIANVPNSINTKKFTNKELVLDIPPFHTKAGPNGPALQSSPLDIIALSRDNTLTENLIEYAEEIDHEAFIDMLEECIDMTDYVKAPNKELVTSRLSIKNEPGGKLRVFAMGDYFTQ